VRSIFITNAATFSYTGRNSHEGHDTLEFQYRVPRDRSRYVLRSGPELQDVVGYHSDFRVDAKTLQLERLVIAIEEIPPKLHVNRAGTELTYAVTRIGGADFLLPHSSELYIVNSNGMESRNITRFEQCRQYLGESVVNFAEPAASVTDTPKPVTEIRLPGGVRIEITLQTAIEGSRVAIGDPVRALVSRNVVKAGAVIVPKGAKVTGRITRLGQRNTGRISYQMLGMQISSLEFADQRADFRGTLESLGFAAAPVTVGAVQDLHGSRQNGDSTASGEGILFIKGNSLHIPAGAHMVWRTADDTSE